MSLKSVIRQRDQLLAELVEARRVIEDTPPRQVCTCAECEPQTGLTRRVAYQEGGRDAILWVMRVLEANRPLGVSSADYTMILTESERARIRKLRACLHPGKELVA